MDNTMMLGSVYVIDLLCIAIIIISALMALARGFVREVLSLLAWVGSIIITISLFKQLSPFFSSFISNPKIADIAAGISLFLASLILLSLLAVLISSAIKNSHLGAVDRSLGFLFGILRGGVIISVFYLLGSLIVPPQEQPAWVRSAKLQPLMASGALMISHLIPEHVWTNGISTTETPQITPNIPDPKQSLPNLYQPKVTPPGTPANPEHADTPTIPEGYNKQERQSLDKAIEIIDEVVPPSEEE